jgi:hypothetical protein
MGIDTPLKATRLTTSFPLRAPLVETGVGPVIFKVASDVAVAAVRKFPVVIVVPSTFPTAQVSTFCIVVEFLQNSAVKLTVILFMMDPVSFLIKAPMAIVLVPVARTPKALSVALAAP